MTRLIIHAKFRTGEELHAEGQIKNIYKKLLKLIAMLPEPCRKTFELNKLHGLSVPEVALYIGCSVESVQEQLELALRLIREDVDKIRIELFCPCGCHDSREL